jgi:predicted HTH transcriptional regulator
MKSAVNESEKNKKVATSGKKVATSNLLSNFYYGKSLKSNELEKTILMICKDKYVKKESLAQILGKSEKYIRNKILPELLKTGKLEKRFPFTDNHPEQGYKTTKEYADKL